MNVWYGNYNFQESMESWYGILPYTIKNNASFTFKNIIKIDKH